MPQMTANSKLMAAIIPREVSGGEQTYAGLAVIADQSLLKHARSTGK